MGNYREDPSQFRSIDPFHQRVFQYETDLSDIYLSRVSNQNLNAIASDVVLKGFKEVSTSYAATSVTVNVGPGLAILDKTLCENTEDPFTSIVFPDANLEDSVTGRFVLHLNFKWLQVIENNPMYIALSWVDTEDTGNVIHNDGLGWNTLRDRIVLGVYSFTKSGGNIDSFQLDPNYPIGSTVTISGIDYVIGGFDPEKANMTSYLINALVANASGTPGATSISVNNTDDILTLDGDPKTVGDPAYYGTDEFGVKGWYEFAGAAGGRYNFDETIYVGGAPLVMTELQNILVDTRSNYGVIYLPPSPNVGDRVTFADAYGTFAPTYYCVVVAGDVSEYIEYIYSPVTMNVKNLLIDFVYTGATRGWACYPRKAKFNPDTRDFVDLSLRFAEPIIDNLFVNVTDSGGSVVMSYEFEQE